MEILPTLVGYALFALSVLHAWIDVQRHRAPNPQYRVQRLLMLVTLFVYGTALEMNGVLSGHYVYQRERFVNLGVVPLSVSLAWVGIIYSAMVVAERMRLAPLLRVLATTAIAMSLDWGMDPIAVEMRIWVWRDGGAYFGVPGFNMLGWFFIPIAYLLAYGLTWDWERRRPRVLGIREVDTRMGWGRKLYTLVLVPPLAFVFLLGLTLITQAIVPGVTRLPLTGMVTWAVLTVGSALAVLIWRRDYLAREHWVDLIPPIILTWIGVNYLAFAFVIGRPDLAILMLMTGAPLWVSLGLAWQKV